MWGFQRRPDLREKKFQSPGYSREKFLGNDFYYCSICRCGFLLLNPLCMYCTIKLAYRMPGLIYCTSCMDIISSQYRACLITAQSSLKWTSAQYVVYSTVFRIRDILVRIRGSIPLTNGSGSGSGSGSWFVSDHQDANKKYFFPSFLLFLKVHLHHSSNIKSHQEITKE